jgi:hypothetical protein
MKKRTIFILLTLLTVSCTLTTPQSGPTASATQIATANSTSTSSVPAKTFTAVPTSETLTPTSTAASLPSESITFTALPSVESLKARVTAGLLSCRYGPGAEYLYLYALRAGANIRLIGKTDANDWVWVDGTNKCWVKSTFLEVDGDWRGLPVVYPGIAKLPITPYYPPSSWANAARKGNRVEITWEEVPVSPGDYEDENMHQYIVEVWRCENGQIIFETLGTNFPFITVENDEAGCGVPSHGNVWVQEKHGYGGPTKVPWPSHPTP